MDASKAVFIVDHAAPSREQVAAMVRAAGLEAVPLAGPDECLALLRRTKPALILLELALAPRRGDDLCRQIKESPEDRMIPVVVMTAQDAPHEVMQSWRAGAEDFLPKPVQRGQLTSKLEVLKGASGGSPRSGGHRSGRKLLFVEESLFFRTLLGGGLEHSGMQLLYARTGEEALALAEQHKDSLDGMIAELNLSSMSGLELAQALRAKDWFARKTILLTSALDVTPELQERARAVTDGPVVEKRVLPIEAIVAHVNHAFLQLQHDLRVTERAPFFSVVEFSDAKEEQWLSGFSYDVSSGGIFVRTMTALPMGTQVKLKVRFNVGQPSTCTGMVAWANPLFPRSSFSYPVGMGIRFTQIDPQQQEQITRLVKIAGRSRMTLAF